METCIMTVVVVESIENNTVITLNDYGETKKRCKDNRKPYANHQNIARNMRDNSIYSSNSTHNF